MKNWHHRSGTCSPRLSLGRRALDSPASRAKPPGNRVKVRRTYTTSQNPGRPCPPHFSPASLSLTRTWNASPSIRFSALPGRHATPRVRGPIACTAPIPPQVVSHGGFQEPSPPRWDEGSLTVERAPKLVARRRSTRGRRAKWRPTAPHLVSGHAVVWRGGSDPRQPCKDPWAASPGESQKKRSGPWCSGGQGHKTSSAGGFSCQHLQMWLF